jgi:leucyl-tRNA synthetase
MEHTTLHLLYSRFWHKFLFDQKLVPTSEPYAKRTSHGVVLAEDGTKMSKSKGNVINPDEVVERLGADTLRLYEMFMGPFEQMIPWSGASMIGCRKFIEKVWRQHSKIKNPTYAEASAGRKKSNIKNAELEILLHQTIKKVSEDIEAMKFNTAVSSMMIFGNALDKEEEISSETYRTFLQLLAPFAPHVAEELWERVGGEGSVHGAPWPVFDPKKTQGESVIIGVQIDGKVRAQIETTKDAAEEEVKMKALAHPLVQKWVGKAKVKKAVYVPGRLINLVLG